jgi:hypothetical protein
MSTNQQFLEMKLHSYVAKYLNMAAKGGRNALPARQRRTQARLWKKVKYGEFSLPFLPIACVFTKACKGKKIIFVGALVYF